MRCSDCGEPMTPETIERQCVATQDHPFRNTCEARCSCKLVYRWDDPSAQPAGRGVDPRCDIHGTAP